MVTLRYHFLTIAAIFLSLGLGIILGGGIGQNWLNEKQQAILSNLEKKYDEAMQNNEQLQQQLHSLSLQLQDTNKDNSRLVNSEHFVDLQGKRVGIWQQTPLKTEQLRQFLTSVGLEIIELGEEAPVEAIYFPVIFIGEALPGWSNQLEQKYWIHTNSLSASPSEKWELLRSIQMLYKENNHEY